MLNSIFCFFEANKVILYRLRIHRTRRTNLTMGLGPWVVWYPMDEDAATNGIETWVVAVV